MNNLQDSNSQHRRVDCLAEEKRCTWTYHDCYISWDQIFIIQENPSWNFQIIQIKWRIKSFEESKTNVYFLTFPYEFVVYQGKSCNTYKIIYGVHVLSLQRYDSWPSFYLMADELRVTFSAEQVHQIPACLLNGMVWASGVNIMHSCAVAPSREGWAA